jgi:hypothetical protein
MSVNFAEIEDLFSRLNHLNCQQQQPWILKCDISTKHLRTSGVAFGNKDDNLLTLTNVKCCPC